MAYTANRLDCRTFQIINKNIGMNALRWSLSVWRSSLGDKAALENSKGEQIDSLIKGLQQMWKI